MIIRAFITHKRAENFADCQDRFGVNVDTKSIAVSDGMSQSWQQKIWAQLLVDTFVSSKDWQPTGESIKPLCGKWREEVEKHIQNLKETNAPEHLIYRNERNLVEGRSAGATFVGIRFIGNDWSGSVLGDSCLIDWNGQQAIFHTSQHVESFDNCPDYFDSNVSREGKGTPKNIKGTMSEDSALLLVSDPFSDFLFEHNKQGDIANYINQLLDISSHDKFEKVVEEWRVNDMHNDDTTLIIVQNNVSDSFSVEVTDDINSFIEEEARKSENNKMSNEIKVQEERKDTNISLEGKALNDVEFVNTDGLINEFLEEYQNALKCIVKALKNLKFNDTKKAVKNALCKMFERYSVIKK